MSTETRPRAPETLPDPDAEQEIDFGRYWRQIALRWWLPLAGVIAGLVIGYVVSLGTSSTTWKATAQVYLGQQLAPQSATPISSAPTSLGLVSNFVTSEATVRRAAARSGLKPGRLRRNISSKPILGITTGKVGTPAPLIAITVEGKPPGKVARAANALASFVVDEVSPYTDVKIDTLEEQLAFDEREIDRVNSRLTLARQQQAEILGNRTLGTAERLLLLANINTALITGEQRLGTLEQDRLTVRQLLSLAQDVERARVVSPAVATKADGPNSRTGAAIGALIGLIIGVLAALLWDPIAARRATPAS
jgi:capsular polysaccharide biosynthesis protein